MIQTEKNNRNSASVPDSLRGNSTWPQLGNLAGFQELQTCSRAGVRGGATIACVSLSPPSQQALGGSIAEDGGGGGGGGGAGQTCPNSYCLQSLKFVRSVDSASQASQCCLLCIPAALVSRCLGLSLESGCLDLNPSSSISPSGNLQQVTHSL